MVLPMNKTNMELIYNDLKRNNPKNTFLWKRIKLIMSSYCNSSKLYDEFLKEMDYYCDEYEGLDDILEFLDNPEEYYILDEYYEEDKSELESLEEQISFPNTELCNKEWEVFVVVKDKFIKIYNDSLDNVLVVNRTIDDFVDMLIEDAISVLVSSYAKTLCNEIFYYYNRAVDVDIDGLKIYYDGSKYVVGIQGTSDWFIFDDKDKALSKFMELYNEMG